MPLDALTTALSDWIRDQGWRYSPTQLLEKWSTHTFDWRNGTETTAPAELPTLQIDSPNKAFGARYQPSPVYSLRKILRRLDIDFSRYSFIDFGSGKGRTLLLASELPFKQVIGVEFSAELNACAARNIQRYRNAAASSIRTIHADAARFELPADPLVIYFFNPFGEVVLKSVLANLVESLQIRPRPVLVVFLYLDYPHLLDTLEGFHRRDAWRRYAVYEFAAH